jgi:hypothetical protein
MRTESSVSRQHLIIACASIAEELAPIIPPGVELSVLKFGLHHRPEDLRRRLQQEIDANKRYESIVLGYGLCSLAVVGLRSESSRLIVPRVDDCISVFLGSRGAYLREARLEPGTFYLTKGWIEAGDTPFSEHESLVKKYGAARADRITRLILKNYTRVALIDTGRYELKRYRAYGREAAERFGLRFEEIEGSKNIIKKLALGPWDADFVVAEPGRALCYEDFVCMPTCPEEAAESDLNADGGVGGGSQSL